MDKLTGIRQIQEICQYRLKRPNFSIMENPKMWWKYVLDCYGHSLKTRDEKFVILTENLRYMRIYKVIISNPNENLSNEDKDFKAAFESNRHISDLIIMRRICFEKVFTKGLTIKSYNDKGKNMLFHWFPNWMGWYGTSTATSPEQDESLQHLEDDILVALEDSIQSQSQLKGDSVFAHFTIQLVKGFLNLQTEESSKSHENENEYIEMQFNDLNSFIQLNLLLTSYKVGISLGEVYLLDKTNNESKHTMLIKPQTDRLPSIMQTNFSMSTLSTSKGDPLFQLQYENDNNLQFRLLIKSKSLDLIYNKSAVNWILNFFTKSNNISPTPNNNYHVEKENRFLSSWNHLLLGNKVRTMKQC